MILAVCPNPALDITYRVDRLVPGESHRVSQVLQRPGGKGVNVAAVLHEAAAQVTATGLVGGASGAELACALDQLDVPHRFSHISGPTRRTVTVVAGDEATALNEPGPTVGGDEWRTFTALFGSLTCDAAVVTLSGSLPAGLPIDAYAELTRLAHDQGAPVVLDCSGAPLVAALSAGPDVVKVNAEEAGAAIGRPTGTMAETLSAAIELRRMGAVECVVTRGADGLVASTTVGDFGATPGAPVTGNPTGAGDAFTAGLALGIEHGEHWLRRLRLAAGWAAGAVARPTAGSVDPAVAAHHQTALTFQEITV
ncbi:1-phosphofructokinase family hexose kinase [Flexivirga sp. ID2601S]|uniref:1-phosphofructokinase family hexose kinase n=1 Tax=Flexivirga aerilata TaxID=1656889 RepID=A0A849AIF7_9MICO|nr:1-phosphofructokinase family hexose kinase [Flexivirga aerilata]